MGWVCGFDRVPIGEPAHRILWLQNSSDRDVSLGAVEVVNDGSAVFRLTSAACAGATLPAVGTELCPVSVRFAPVSAREYTGRILVHLPENEVKTLELVGSGAVPEFSESKVRRRNLAAEQPPGSANRESHREK